MHVWLKSNWEILNENEQHWKQIGDIKKRKSQESKKFLLKEWSLPGDLPGEKN